MNRYALYYRLLDIAIAAQILILADSACERLFGIGAISDRVPQAYSGIVLIIVSTLAFLLPSLLVFQRWMRDEFSEGLWQRTAGTVLKCLIILPLPLAFAAGLANYLDPPTLKLSVDSAVSGEVQAMIRGSLYATVYTWLLTPVVFTFAFQWHRWRASR